MRRARRTGWPVWTRLVGLVLVPLVGIVLVAVPSVRDRLEVVEGTETTEERVAALNALLDLRFSLTSEAESEETQMRSRAYGLTSEAASRLIGFDLEGRTVETRVEVDRMMDRAAVRSPDVAADVAALIARVRAEADSDEPSVAHAHLAYVKAIGRVGDGTTRVLDALASSATSPSGQARGLETATNRLVIAFDLVTAGQNQLDALFRLIVPGASVASGLGPARTDLITHRAVYDNAERELRRSGSAATDAELDALTARPDVQTFRGAVERVLASEGATTFRLDELAATFRAGIARTAYFRTLVDTAASEATAIAHLRRVEAVDRLRAEIAIIVAVVVASALAALLIAWSITRRLRRLAARAGQVSQGQLGGEPADERGPRQVTVVARALNDTVANLRQIEQQASALARGDLNEAVLAVPVAGVLGESIHATVHGLSLAWREREELQQRLAHQANHDLLTALPNRKAAMEALELALGRAHRHGEAVAVLFIDLDGFKRPNDTYGHHVGDRILRICAERLGSTVRAGDALARLGGDEFVVITERLSSPRHAVELGQRIIEVLSEPLDVDGVVTRVGASVGVGMSLDGRATPLDLLRDADNAVHRAKKLGKGRVELFDEGARDELAAQAELERDLRVALERRDLHLHYQPVTDTMTGGVHGFEALCRWERDGVPVSPAAFIPVAEQSDLVNDIGRWALVEATTQLAAWNRDGRFDGAYVAVNVSGRHLLSSSLVADVEAALAASGLPARQLVIEITETVIVTDLLTAVAHLEAVRALGVRVALDDFGTGYTSIGQLWRLPIDVLKIDGSFVRHLETAHDHVIVELMIEVAHTLGLGLVAEGVETTTQHDTLKALHCDAIQGFLIARPQSPEQLTVNAGP